MGFLAAIGGGSGSVLGPVLNYRAVKQTNAANAQMARSQMAFQDEQSSTAYQRAVVDMQKAGLNPMLAYSQGGASAGSGAQATMEAGRPGDALSGILATAQAVANLKKTEAETNQVEANTVNLAQQGLKMVAETRLTNASASQAERGMEDQLRLLGLKVSEGGELVRLRRSEADYGERSLEDRLRLRRSEADYGERSLEDRLRSADYSARLTGWQGKRIEALLPFEVRKAIADAVIGEWDTHRAKAQGEMWQSPFGREVLPYILGRGGLANSAWDAAVLGRYGVDQLGRYFNRHQKKGRKGGASGKW